MCRKLIYLISFVLVLGLAGYAAAAPGDMNNPILIPATGQAPVIDGVRDANLWSGGRYLITKLDNGTAPGDPCVAARTSSWWAMWDSQNFYVFVDVNDAALVGAAPELWNDDSVEVMIDICNHDRATSYPPIGIDSYQYRFAWPSPYLINHSIATGEEYFHSTRSMPGVQWFVKNHPKGQDPNGYTVEMKFPWTSMYYTPDVGPPTIGDLMGLDFHVNNSEVAGSGRLSQWAWYSSNEAVWSTPTLMGTVKFMGALTATNPIPVNNATGVLDTILQWTAGGGAKTHDVYFGTTYPPPKVSPGQVGTSYDPPGVLSPGTTYYWKVDEVNNAIRWPGYDWRFTTAPATANDPDPCNGAPVVLVDANLSWGPGFYATAHNVYLGTNPASLPLVSGAQATTTYAPGGLNGKTKYYWRVDEIGPPDYAGPVWSFDTASALTGLRGEYFDNPDLSGNPLLVRTDLNIDFDWGQDAPDPRLPVDNFSVRWTADLNVPSAGTYTFFILRSVRPPSDSVRLWVNGEQLVNDWPGNDTIVEDSGSIFLPAGDALLVMEYQDTSSTAVAKLSWQCLPSLPKQIIPVGRFTRPLLTMAGSPSPFNKDIEASATPTLTWTPGIYAAATNGHKLYFSNDFNDVNERKIAAGPHTLSNPSYTPGLLPRSKTYYWRVDEVNDACSTSPWKGDIWRFTVPIYEVVDNFELYTTTGTRDLENFADPILPATIGPLRRTWIDGLWNMEWSYPNPITTATSGSYVQLNTVSLRWYYQ